MSSKYQELYRLPENLYQVDCPVIIEAGALYKNTDDSSVLVQLKLRNINLKRIISCKVVIQAFEINGSPIEGEEIGSYLDILVKTGELFGQKIPIYLSDNNTRLFEISIIEVVFEDRAVWTSDGSKPIQLPTPNDLSSVIASGDLREQYLIEFGQRCHLAPMLWNGLFFCSCGAINLEGNPCHNCGHTYDSLLSMMDEAFLRQKADERARALEQARERERIAKEQARIAKENAIKKTKKIALIVIPIVVICAIALLVYRHIIIPNQKYDAAIALINEGNYEKAYDALKALNGYKDSESKAAEIQEKYEVAKECSKLKEKLRNAKVGSYISFGSYMQNNTEKKDSIEWLVLDKDDEKMFVVSRYALDYKEFNNSSRPSWANSSIRKWLNEEFMDTAFTYEKNIIMDSVTEAYSSSKNNSSTKNGIRDKIFLLDISEVEEYLNSRESKKCKPTEYAKKQGGAAYSSSTFSNSRTVKEDNCDWWLRTPGSTDKAKCVTSDGEINSQGRDVQSLKAVRPSLWIQISPGETFYTAEDTRDSQDSSSIESISEADSKREQEILNSLTENIDQATAEEAVISKAKSIVEKSGYLTNIVVSEVKPIDENTWYIKCKCQFNLHEKLRDSNSYPHPRNEWFEGNVHGPNNNPTVTDFMYFGGGGVLTG